MPNLQKLLLLSFICLTLGSCKQSDDSYQTWEVYKGGPEANNYSSLDQVNQKNINNLEVAWSFYPDDAPEGFQIWKYECNPIVIGNIMYLTSAWRWLYAVDASTGEELWSFDPLDGQRGGGVLRGVTYWKGDSTERIFVNARSKLYCVDANTGRLVTTFGDNGSISLNIDLEGQQNQGTIRLSTPGIIYKDLIIIGAVVSESAGAAPGHVRAFNVHTGKLAWIFHTIPKPGEFGYDTWPEEAHQNIGGANNWAGMSLDKERGIVYVPIGSPTYDYYASNRIGSNLFGNCLLALNAATGEYIWHFQTVHHDIWDYDLPTAPNLITVEKDGMKIDAVAQPTKMGFIFVLDRETGAPVFPIEERPVPASRIPGEKAWPTQPFPLKPEPFARQAISEDDIIKYSDESYIYNIKIINELYHEGLYTPLGSKTTLMFPGSRGGGEWGGGAYDPTTGVIYINSNDLPELGRIEKVQLAVYQGKTLYAAGRRFYETHCSSCHGANKLGIGSNPSLINIDQRRSTSEIVDIINNGSGIMPSFNAVLEGNKEELMAFLTETGKQTPNKGIESQDTTTAYLNVANKAFLLDTLGRPIVKPPWGTMNAINLNTAEYVWKIPLGSDPEYQKPDKPPTGMENYGGPVVTAGGLLFIAATLDSMFRAFDKETGELLWEFKLPGNGLATPSVYMINGKQYISIAVSIGENLNHTKSGIITFSLPNQ